MSMVLTSCHLVYGMVEGPHGETVHLPQSCISPGIHHSVMRAELFWINQLSTTPRGASPYYITSFSALVCQQWKHLTHFTGLEKTIGDVCAASEVHLGELLEQLDQMAVTFHPGLTGLPDKQISTEVGGDICVCASSLWTSVCTYVRTTLMSVLNCPALAIELQDRRIFLLFVLGNKRWSWLNKIV